MKALVSISLTIILMFASACNSGPKPIMYGEENCTYCSMTIMDDKHAAEIITAKGRVYVYDSIECMIRSLEAYDEIETILVMDFKNPGTFLDATQATYLVAPRLPSPMGANLSAFETEVAASSMGYSGTLYTWETIQIHIN